LGNLNRFPFDIEDHDKWLELETHQTCYIARSTNRNKTISCSQNGPWLFCNIWTAKSDAIEYLNANGEGPDDYTLEQISCAELFGVYRAVKFNGKPMLVTGITSAIQVSTTYVPTQRLVTDPIVMWMYATHKDELLTKKGALVVALTPVTLMSELFEIVDNFDEGFVSQQYKLHCCTFLELLALCDEVYTDGYIYTLKEEMAYSKVIHQMALNTKEGKDV